MAENSVYAPAYITYQFTGEIPQRKYLNYMIPLIIGISLALLGGFYSPILFVIGFIFIGVGSIFYFVYLYFNFDDFKKLDIRVGEVKEAQPVPKSKNLIKSFTEKPRDPNFILKCYVI